MTEKKKKTQAGDSDRLRTLAGILTLAGDPLPIDPDTGKVIMEKLTDKQREKYDKHLQTIAEAGKFLVPKIKDQLQGFVDSLNNFLQNTIEIDTQKWRELYELLLAASETWQPLSDLIHEINDLEQYLKAELQKPENAEIIEQWRDPKDKKREHDEIRVLFHKFDDPGVFLEQRQDPTSFVYKVFEAAKAAKAAEPIDIETYRADALNTPIDRVNFLAWDSFKDTGGQIKFNLMSETDKRNPERRDLDISMRFSLSFGDDPDIKTTKELNHYDRRLTQAIDTLMTNGKDIILTSEIFYGMGGTGSASDNQADKINDSLTKQGTARVYINNKAEAAQYDYPEIVYDGNVLNFERIIVRYKGQEREAIKMLRRPVMMEFADQRDQITKVPMRVLQSPVSKTDNNLRIEDYLLYRIVRQKNELNALQKAQAKRYTQKRQAGIRKERELVIALDTFYEKIGVKDKKAIVKQRALKTAARYLSHYADESVHYIENFKIKEDSIIITLPIKE